MYFDPGSQSAAAEECMILSFGCNIDARFSCEADDLPPSEFSCQQPIAGISICNFRSAPMFFLFLSFFFSHLFINSDPLYHLLWSTFVDNLKRGTEN